MRRSVFLNGLLRFDPSCDESMAERKNMDQTAELVNSSMIDFDALLLRCLGNATLAERVLARFTNRFDPDLNEMDRAYREGDCDRTALVAHRLKGAAANLTASSLAEIASEIESLARQEEMQGVDALIGDLRALWNTFQEESLKDNNDSREVVGERQLIESAETGGPVSTE